MPHRINKCAAYVAAATVLGCAVMAIVDGVISPTYAVKSAVKIVLFAGLPIVFALCFDKDALRSILLHRKKGIILSLLIGMAIYAFIVGGYFALRGVFDFSAVTSSLTSGEGVTRDNFLYVAAYISICNSLLEELFFRGFAFHTLNKYMNRGIAYVFSALSFAVYHVAIMSGWFSPLLFVLLVAGLFAGGVIFNYLDEKTGSIYPSWIVHMFANLATNTVGCVLFGIL